MKKMSALATIAAIAAAQDGPLSTLPSTYRKYFRESKYKPHQGAQECARRVEQGINGTRYVRRSYLSNKLGDTKGSQSKGIGIGFSNSDGGPK
jgi:hypothetical protein